MNVVWTYEQHTKTVKAARAKFKGDWIADPERRGRLEFPPEYAELDFH